jgi:hypothetical protein
MMGLQSVLFSRKNHFHEGSEDFRILYHYDIVLKQLASELNSLVVDDDFVPQHPALSMHVAKDSQTSSRPRASSGASTTCSVDRTCSEDSISIQHVASLDTVCDIDTVNTAEMVDSRCEIDVDSVTKSMLVAVRQEFENVVDSRFEFDPDSFTKSMLIAVRKELEDELEIDSLRPVRHLLVDDLEDEESESKEFDTRCSARIPKLRSVVPVYVDVDNLSHAWQLLEDE